jgi:5-methylcytosine-specific restriction endonuclease McrA
MSNVSKYTPADISVICSKYSHVYIDGYKDSKTKFNCICACGRSWSAYLGVIIRGGRCRQCHPSRIITDLVLEKELLKYDLKLLSQNNNSKFPIIYECTCGSIGKTTIGSIRNGVRCGHCKEMQWREYFLDYGCEIIEYNTVASIKYICYCGNEYITTGHNFSRGSKTCPKCRTYYNFNPNKIRLRPALATWKKEVLISNNYTCQLCLDEDNLCVHHIEAYSVKPELASMVDNGITLCYDCHKFLHSKYGINVGRDNLNLALQGGYHECTNI